jgi:hypothetical protein
MQFEVYVMDVESRLKRLERTNRLLVTLLVLFVVVVGFNIGSRVDAATSTEKKDIVANSVTTRSLAVVNPTGKQVVKIEVDDDGMVGVGVADADGEETIDLLSDPSGTPSICLSYHHVCRIVIGDVYRGNQREFSVQLRNKDKKTVWMPGVANPEPLSGRNDLNK